MMQLQLVTACLSLLVFGSHHVNSACPAGNQVAQQITSCLSEINRLTDFSKGPITGAQLNNYCNSSARTTEVQCAENLINDCRNSGETIRRDLQKAVNINAIKGSVNIVCNNAQLFVEKEDCIGQYQTTVTACTNSRLVSYNSKLQSLKSQAYSKGEEWFEEKRYEELCDYFGDITDCQKSYGRNCGHEVGDVFDALMHSATPPVCVVSAGIMEHVNPIVLISLAFMALVKRTF